MREEKAQKKKTKKEIRATRQKICKRFLKNVDNLREQAIESGNDLGLYVTELPRNSKDVFVGILLLLSYKRLSVLEAHTLIRRLQNFLEAVSKVDLYGE